MSHLRLIIISLVFLLCMACQPMMSIPDEPSDDNIVIGMVTAPPDPKGLVADQPIGINILLNAPGVENQYASDPQHFGHQIPAGGRMEIELGGSYIRNGVDNEAEFVPVDSNFHLILLAGNPQNAIVEVAGDGAQHANYTIADDGDKIITVTPNGGSGAHGLEGARAKEIGVKTVHLLSTRGSNTGPSAFQNGPAGTIGTANVRIYNADGTMIESGEGSITFQESVGRQVSPVNFGLATGPPFSPAVIATELFEATNFQRVGPGTQLVNTQRGDSFSATAPYALRFLLLEAIEAQPDSFSPYIGIPNVGLVVDAETPSQAVMVQDTNGDGTLDDSDERVGQVTIEGPGDESPGRILAIAGWPLTVSGNGVEGPPGSFFNVPIEVGQEPGIYRTTVSLDEGGQATVYTVVEAPTATALTETKVELTRVAADVESPSGHSVVVDCQDEAATYPYQPYDWPDASATLTMQHGIGRSNVTIEMKNARPNTYYTAWVRLRGDDSSGESFGGNPLTGGGATPLAPSSELPNLLAATGEGNGNDQLANGFYTDEMGNAHFKTNLDFPVLNGAYPFHKFTDFDPSDARFPVDDPHIYPVAIVGAEGPFTIRLASHCTDSVGHGLVPGNRETWFQWSFSG